MRKRYILGIADNDRFASAVVGDLSGRIIATSTGGSVNHHYWGMEQARRNFRDLVYQTLGLDGGSCLAGACITYKADFSLSDWRTLDLVSGFLNDVDVGVADFATSSLLGMHGSEDRLLLIGGNSGLAVLENAEGRRFQSRKDGFTWSPLVRICSKLEETKHLPYLQCKESLLHIKTLFSLGKDITTVADYLDRFVCHGSILALEVAHDIALDLVRMAAEVFCNVSDHHKLTIGLYGQVLLGSETVRSRVRHLLRLLFPHSPIVEVPLAPAKGAYLSALLARRSNLATEISTNTCVQVKERMMPSASHYA